MKVSWPDSEPNSWPCDWPLHYILWNSGDNRDFQLFSIFIMLKGLSRNIFKVNRFILLLLFVPIWSIFHSLLMNFCFHLSFLRVPHGPSRWKWELITWNLLLCNLLCHSFLIGSLGLRRESCELGNKRCLPHAPRIKGTWCLTLHSFKGYWFRYAHIYQLHMGIVQVESHAFKLLLCSSLSVCKDLILILFGWTDRRTLLLAHVLQ